jgi:hypothetical protein
MEKVAGALMEVAKRPAWKKARQLNSAMEHGEPHVIRSQFSASTPPPSDAVGLLFPLCERGSHVRALLLGGAVARRPVMAFVGDGIVSVE